MYVFGFGNKFPITPNVAQALITFNGEKILNIVTEYKNEISIHRFEITKGLNLNLWMFHQIV